MFFIVFVYIHRKYSCSERYKPSTKPIVNGAGNVRGLGLILLRRQSVMILLLMNSKPFSVTGISGNPSFAIQCS